MFYKLNSVLNLIIFFITARCLQAFNVNFQYNYKLQVEPFNTQIYKRELNQFFDKASFSLKGFEKLESIPVSFPIDICILKLENIKYAAALHIRKNGARHFVLLRMMNGFYDLIADVATPNGIGMDCINFNNKGYIALALNLTQTVNYAMQGSPLLEIAGNRLRAIQYFSAPNLMSVYLRVSGNDFFLLHTYKNAIGTTKLSCPYFKWSGTSFNKMGQIPCSNARQLAPFSIDYESYVAVANYADQNGRTNTNSEIYKFSQEKKKYILFQKIKTNGAVDVIYFNVPYNEEKKKHFLIFGNSLSTFSSAKSEKSKQDAKNLEADSVVYIFDKGQFLPYQKLSFYAVNKFLPVQNTLAEKFVLLVACKDQDIKIYNLNDWKFEESKVQFTAGAIGKGVSNMRIYQENDNSYLIIANELMVENETNIFRPIFKQEEDANILRQQIIDWAKQQTKRLLTTNIHNLRQRVESKIQRLGNISHLSDIQHIPQANIPTVTTESLIYPALKMSGNYWTALGYINQALDVLEEQFKQKQRLKRKIEHTAPYESMEYVHDTLNIKNLKVNKSLKAKRVNKVLVEDPVFQNIKAKKVIVTEKYNKSPKDRFMIDFMDEDEMFSVNKLQITGKLNQYNWKDLFNNTLKRKEVMQFIKAPIEIEKLKTDVIVVNNDKVNEQNLEALIPIDGGKHFINQDVHFAGPVHANEVITFEQLNNLHVLDGQLDVLLKKANKTQVVEGLKNVTNIKALESLTVAGKMKGRQLKTTSSHKFINDSLVLQGNFIINGNVSIKHQLNTLDIIDLKEKLSLKQVLDKGIRLDKNSNVVNLKFMQPLRANNSLISFINGHDLQRLIKLNQSDIQIIEGEKVFNGSLHIKRGFSEVKNLNGIDMEELEQNAFLKNTNQSIKVPIKINKVTTKRIESINILLNNKSIFDYLMLTGNQSIQGSLIVDDLKALNLKVEHLNTDNKIFHQHVNDIYQHKFHNSSQDNLQVFQENRKFHGSVYVKNLILNNTINNKAVQDIEHQLLQLEGNIKYVGNIKFNYAMNVTNVTFQGKLNDILAKDFGKCWLQKKAVKQEFTAVQTFATLHADNGIQLHNKLNGFTMEDLYTQTYWINRDEYLGNVHFENPIEMTSSLITQRLNECLATEDMFFKDMQNAPIILNSLSINKNLKVQGTLKNITSINDINLYKLQKYLNHPNDNTLFVENAYFSQAIPLYRTLNNHNIKKTLDSAWLANENVILPHHVEIADAHFEGILEYEGAINDMNLNYLSKNYFSKTRPQDVSIEMVVSDGVMCNKDLNVQELYVFGKLFEQESAAHFHFNEFVQNTLKTTGPHIISGNWSLQEAIVQGSINNVLVNQLNLLNDVVLDIKPLQAYKISSRKIFKNAEIEKLYTNNISVVNNVPVAKWIRDAVYLYENYTIKGTTTIDSLNVYNNLIALGRVNNITFNKHNLLLKDAQQYLPGSLKIISYLAQSKRFLTNNIENLNVEYINQQHVPTFVKNLVPNDVNAELKSHLIFTQPVKIETYESTQGLLAHNQWSKKNIDKQTHLSSKSDIAAADFTLKEFKKIKHLLNNVTKDYSYKIAHFDIKQFIKVVSSEIFAMSLKNDSSKEDILIILDVKYNSHIYKWIPEQQQYKKSNDFNWMPQDPISLKIIQKRFEWSQHPIDINDLKTFINQYLTNIYKALEYPQMLNYYFEFLNETCIIYAANATFIKDITKYCLNNESNTIALNLPEHKQQFKNLKGNSLALLTNNTIYIYNVTANPAQLKQKIITTLQPKQMAFGYFNNMIYLGILSKRQTNALNKNFVEIYRSLNFGDFVLFQLLECSQPCLQIKFSNITKSNDLLLHIITNSSTAPYLIYQYQGVMGFQKVLSDSILPRDVKHSQIINLHTTDQYLVALSDKEHITFMEIVLKPIL